MSLIQWCLIAWNVWGREDRRRRGRKIFQEARPPRPARLELESLEDRCLFALPVAPGVWQPIGPAPLHDLVGTFGARKQDEAGEVNALALSTNYDGKGHQALYLGATRRVRIDGLMTPSVGEGPSRRGIRAMGAAGTTKGRYQSCFGSSSRASRNAAALW
jgi:hypothetical protein